MQTITITVEEIGEESKRFKMMTVQDGGSRAVISFLADKAPDSVLCDALAQYFARKANKCHKNEELLPLTVPNCG